MAKRERKRYRSPHELAQENLVNGMADAIGETLRSRGWKSDEYQPQEADKEDCREAARQALKFWREAPWMVTKGETK